MQETDFGKIGFGRVVKFKGLLDFQGLYDTVKGWMFAHDYDFFEYKIKDKPPVYVIRWWARKKVNFYIMWGIDIEYWQWGAKPVEIIKDGVKKEVLDTRIEIKIGGRYISDYDGDFEKNAFLKKLETLLNDYILENDMLLKHFDVLDYHLYDLMQVIKKYLEMETASNAY